MKIRFLLAQFLPVVSLSFYILTPCYAEGNTIKEIKTIGNLKKAGLASAAVSKKEILVKYKDHPGVLAVSKKKTGEMVSKNESLHVERMRIPAGRTQEQELAAYRSDPNVEFAEVNETVEAHFIPNDPHYHYQWNLDDNGSVNPYGGANGGGIGMEDAWNAAQGNPLVIVAVVDTGVAYEDFGTFKKAPDFANTAFLPGYDFINNDEHANDDNGHGTHVAGTIAQSTNNSLGTAGIAFKTTIMPVKVLDAGGYGTFQSVADGITYAADHGAKVINLSLGSASSSLTMQAAVSYAHSRGVTVIASSGNAGGAVGYPAAYDNDVIAVGATRYDETRSYYSNFGTSLDLAAPGGDPNVDQNQDGYGDGILQQTFVTDPANFSYYFISGTSMAAPHVSGLAALIIQKGADTPERVREALEATAEDKGTPGRDDLYGWGLIDAKAALSYAATTGNQVAYWKLDQSAVDASGHGHQGTLNNMTFDARAASTPFFNPFAAVFNGVNAYIQIPHDPPLNALPISLTAWVRLAPNGKNGGILSKFLAGSFQGYQISLSGTNLYANYYKDKNNYVSDGSLGLWGGELVPGIWQHVAFVVDTTGGSFYKDGVLKSKKSWTGVQGPTVSTEAFRIGNSSSAGYFPGQIDDVRVYNRILTASEITALAARVDKTAPLAPGHLAAAPGDAREELTWDANQEPDLAGYYVYRSTSSGGPFTRVFNPPLNALSYSDTGLNNGSTYYYKLSAVDIYGNESALTAALSSAPNGPVIISRWKLDNDAQDLQGTNHGTVAGGIFAAIIPPVQFQDSFSLTLDGVSQQVSIPHSLSLNAFPVSTAFWIKTTQASADAGILNKYLAGSYNGYQVYLSEGKIYAWYFRSRYNCIWDEAKGISGGLVNDGAWHHVVFTVDPAGGKIYVDGVLKASRGWTGAWGGTTTLQPVSFGRYPGKNYFSGTLDDVRIYKRALTLSEIASLAAGGE